MIVDGGKFVVVLLRRGGGKFIFKVRDYFMLKLDRFFYVMILCLVRDVVVCLFGSIGICVDVCVLI